MYNPSFHELFSGISISFIIGSVLLIYFCKNRTTTAFLLLGFFIMYNVLVYINYFTDLFPLKGDAVYYHARASKLAAALAQGKFSALFSDRLDHANYWFSILLAFNYLVFGTSPLVGRIFLSIFAIGLIYNLTELARRYISGQDAYITTLVLILNPFLYWLTLVLVRDIIVLYFISLWFKVLFLSKAKIFKYVKLFIILIILYFVRSLTIPLLVFSLLLSKVINLTMVNYSFINRLIKILLIVAISGATLNIVMTINNEPLSSEDFGGLTEVEKLNRVRVSYLEYAGNLFAGSKMCRLNYKEGVHYYSYGDILYYLPKTTFYAMLYPLPWEVYRLVHFLGLLDSIFLFLMYYYAFKGGRQLYHTKKVFIDYLLIYALLGIMAVGVFHHGFGAMRHRTMFTYPLFPIAAYGLSLSLSHPTFIRRPKGCLDNGHKYPAATEYRYS